MSLETPTIQVKQMSMADPSGYKEHKTTNTPTFHPKKREHHLYDPPLIRLEGTITLIEKDAFQAIMKNMLTSEQFETEEIFEVKDISPRDLPLFKLGAKIRYEVSYRRSRGGQKSRCSQINFV